MFARAPLFGSMPGAWGKTLGFWMFSPGPGASHRAHTLHTPPPKGGGLAGAAPVQNLEEMEKAAAGQNDAAPLPSCHLKLPRPPATNAAPWAKPPLFLGPPASPCRNRCAPCKQPPVCRQPASKYNFRTVCARKRVPHEGSAWGKCLFSVFFKFLENPLPFARGGVGFCRAKSWAFSFFMKKIVVAFPPGLHAHFVPAFIPQFFAKTEIFLCFET